jgi:DNA-binding response OmpR family regulator
LIQAAARAILIVEDDAVLADMLAAVLKDAGYAADVSATPEAARGTYDLVVADYLAPSYAPGRPWPHLDALRSLANGGPILGCTGHPDVLLDSPTSLGVSAVALKPFDVDEFVRLVDRLLADHPPRPSPSPQPAARSPQSRLSRPRRRPSGTIPLDFGHRTSG